MFIVELDKAIGDTISHSGLELYIDTRFNEFENRVTEALYCTVPLRNWRQAWRHALLHHLVVLKKASTYQVDNHYIVKYNHDHAVNNQAIAFKDQHTGVVEPLKGWSLLEPVEEEEVQESEIVEVVKLNETLPTRGESHLRLLGLKKWG